MNYDELREVIRQALERAEANKKFKDIEKDAIWLRHIFNAHYINERVVETWGYELERYLHDNHPKYNSASKVEIIIGNIEHIRYGLNHRLVMFNRVVFHDGSFMFIAYAPEIDTLFVRTLFDIIPTPVDPKDKMDIETRLGL